MKLEYSRFFELIIILLTSLEWLFIDGRLSLFCFLSIFMKRVPKGARDQYYMTPKILRLIANMVVFQLKRLTRCVFKQKIEIKNFLFS